ncbi:L-histidine N(alpha)-methyltransferase [Congregibacter sp.]|uniref:L-histidine N(alpha)-methyltransferase n=1 Tax=Congregibacter sp. TaxID=2744308 RepID=UPI003F6C5EF6
MNEPLGKVSRVSFKDEHPDLGDGREEIIKGLSLPQKSADPKWFYDQRGSELFDEITRLPEYYPTRTEVLILEQQREAIAKICGSDCVLIEPGSGSSEKVRILLDALRPSLYVPIDISASFLRDSAELLGEEYPWLDIHAVCADFNGGWAFLETLAPSPRVVFYPGSTIGNLEPDMALRFLKSLRDMAGPDGGVLIGVDTHKSTERLNAAYNDSAAVTAAFNLNILRRMNELLEADFDESRFSHHAFYNESLRRIEMHLVSNCDQQVRYDGGRFDFREGETIHTECSYKYSLEDFTALARSGGFDIAETWQDDAQLFSVHYLRPTV